MGRVDALDVERQGAGRQVVLVDANPAILTLPTTVSSLARAGRK